jgi:AcrR family transcriptional regulator
MASAATPRAERHAEDASTRERILDAALAAFSEHGFDGATTRAIATRAGVNLGLIPYYFGGKEGLWREAVDRAFGDLRRGLADVLGDLSAGNDRERAARLIRGYVRFVAAHPEFVRLMHEEGKRDSRRMRWLVDRHVRPLFEATCHMIEQGERISRLPAGVDPLHFYYILAGSVGILFHQAPECRRLTGVDPRADAVVEAHAEALVHLLLGTDIEENTT